MMVNDLSISGPFIKWPIERVISFYSSARSAIKETPSETSSGFETISRSTNFADVVFDSLTMRVKNVDSGRLVSIVVGFLEWSLLCILISDPMDNVT